MRAVRSIRRQNKSISSGFTIVELLIVIVVIGILAAITIVTYSGVQNRARASSASSALSQAAKKLAVYRVDNASYPPNGNLAVAGIFDSQDVSFQYSGSGSAFCLTATSGNVSYKISEDTTPISGGCAGHGQGGVAAVTNYAQDPDATTLSGFGQSGASPASSNSSIATDQAYRGSTSFKRVVTANGATGAAARIPNQSLKVLSTQSMSWSLWVYSSRAGTIAPWVDGSKVSDGSYTGCGASLVYVPVATWTKVTGTCTPTFDMYPSQVGAYNLSVQVGDSVWFDAYMVQSGATLSNYADGNTPNWIWNGAANNATSTGPPQ